MGKAGEVLNLEVGEIEEFLELIRQHSISTYIHCVRVAALTNSVCRYLGYPEEQIKEIVYGALIHDIGKIKIPLGILEKADTLSLAEFEIIKLHPLKGYELVQGRFSPVVENAILYHHERDDGSGYPHRLSREHIPQEARIIAVCDIYEALTSKRCYKDSFSHEKAMGILWDQVRKGQIYDKAAEAVGCCYASSYLLSVTKKIL